MKHQNFVWSGIVLLLLAAGFLLAACTTPTPAAPTLVPPTPTPNPVDLVKAYVAAFNKQDLQAVSALVSDDINFVDREAGYSFYQRPKFLGFQSYLFAENSQLQLTDCQTSGAAVTCKMTLPLGDCPLGGLKLMHSEFVFTVINNKIDKIIENDQEDEAKIVNDIWLTKFMPWYQKTYPAEMPKSNDGWWTYDVGAAVAKRCKEFLALK